MTAAFTTDDLLDLAPAVGGERAESFVFDLLGADHSMIERLDVSMETTPHVRVDTGRSVMRTCTGVLINDPPTIDVFQNRVRPSMVLANGDVLPLGVFMLGDDQRRIFSWGEEFTPELFDETFLVDQPLPNTVHVTPGGSILDLFRAIVASCNLAETDITVDDALASVALVYKVGTSRYKALAAMAALLGCYPPFFDNSGVFRLRYLPSPSSPADHEYVSGTRIIDGSPSTTSSIYRAPNEWVAISDDPKSPRVGRYRLPSSSPYSQAATGRRLISTQSFQGLATQVLADQAAYGMMLQDRHSLAKAAFSAPADPRHDTFDIVDLYGDRYLETGWDLACVPGGIMSHSLVRFWEPD